MRKLEDGGWELEYVAGREEHPATASHSAVVLADIMTVRSGVWITFVAGSLNAKTCLWTRFEEGRETSNHALDIAEREEVTGPFTSLACL